MRYSNGLAVSLALCVTSAQAQPPASSEPPASYVYQAIESLAEKGLLAGYPARRNVFNGRKATRYEVASLVKRALERIEELAAQPDRRALSAERWQDLRTLTQDYQVELIVIGTDIKKAEATLDLLKPPGTEPKPVLPPPKEKPPAPQDANLRTAFETLEKDYRLHRFTGYGQLRFDTFDSNGGGLFPPAASTGGPAPGSAQYGFVARRVRVLYQGALSKRVDYRLQVDAASTGPLNLRDIFADIKDIPAKNVTLRIGQYVPPFSAELTSSSRVRESPERAMAFADSAFATVNFRSQLPLFILQDRDPGVSLIWSLPNPTKPQTRVSFGLLNGEGRNALGQRNQNAGLDMAARVVTSLAKGRVELGASFYYGSIVAPTTAGASTVRNAYRSFGAFDARYTAPDGTVFKAEYLFGGYELMPDRSAYVRGNHATGFMAMVAHPITPRLSLVAQYETLNPLSVPVTLNNATYKGSDFNRQQAHFGLLYRIDSAARLRLWYTKALTPYDPTAGAGAGRDRLGYFISEIQVDF